MYVNMVMMFRDSHYVRNLLKRWGTFSFLRKSLIQEVIFRRLGLPRASVPFRNPVWHFLKCSFLPVRFWHSKHQFEYRTCHPTQWIPTGCSVFFFCRHSHQWARASSFTSFLDHTQRGTTGGRPPLDEWLARRRELYQTTRDTHNRQTSRPPVGFKPIISEGERPQTYPLDRTATGIGGCSLRHSIMNQTRRWKAQQKLLY
jgi:hypothetical protein